MQLFVSKTVMQLITRSLQKVPTNDAQKSSVNWSSKHLPMDVPKEQKRRTNQRVPVGYWPKTLQKLSQW